MKLSFLTCSCCTFESSPGLMKTSLTCCSVYCTYIWSTSCCVVVNYVLKGSLTYLCNRNCPPCTWRDQSHQVSHNPWKTPTRSWQQCPCGKHTFILVHYDQSFVLVRIFRLQWWWWCSPVHEAFALQVCQRCAQLVGEQNQRGQVQVVLPYLQKRPQLKINTMVITRWFSGESKRWSTKRGV